jgi:hypothetical protein
MTVEAPITLACALPGRHSPRNLTVELHHIIPVAWQQFFVPPVAPYPGQDPNGRGPLWDARTIALCPTSHRNTHFWIVRLMHAIAAGAPDAMAAWQTLSSRDRRHPEASTAFDALDRFATSGGSLLALTAAGEWGQV